MVRLKNLAPLIDVHEKTLRRWKTDLGMPSVKVSKSIVLFNVDKVIEWIENNDWNAGNIPNQKIDTKDDSSETLEFNLDEPDVDDGIPF